jgi:UDP-glucose 4-epimerase
MEAHDAYCDHNKAKEMLGFKDKTDMEKLIEKMFVWAMKQPRREVKSVEYEVTKGLYSYWKK